MQGIIGIFVGSMVEIVGPRGARDDAEQGWAMWEDWGKDFKGAKYIISRIDLVCYEMRSNAFTIPIVICFSDSRVNCTNREYSYSLNDFPRSWLGATT